MGKRGENSRENLLCEIVLSRRRRRRRQFVEQTMPSEIERSKETEHFPVAQKWKTL